MLSLAALVHGLLQVGSQHHGSLVYRVTGGGGFGGFGCLDRYQRVMISRTANAITERRGRHPDDEVAEATRTGLELVALQTARCRMEFHDVGAVVYVLRKCVWWVPDFTVERYEPQLRDLDRRIRSTGPFVAHSTRHLIDARHPFHGA